MIWIARSVLAFVFASAGGLAALAQPPTSPAIALPRLVQPGSTQVFYFVLTDRFANGDPRNDQGGIAGTRDQHGFDPTVISHFHGGDFVGLTQHLDYIRHLGATAIWVTPPFTNKPVQLGSAGYHGYWITDFLHIDPHLGTDREFRTFVREAHARGLKVYLDIVINHTADVIAYREGESTYRSHQAFPLRDTSGKPFAESSYAYNGLGSDYFPPLSAEKSFAYVPVVTAKEAAVKQPRWLNNVTLYHNRGNSTFAGESSLYGDFVGLDDVMTEHPRVVRGFIDVFSHWVRDYQVDGFRIDTVKHVNREFWQAFSPAIKAEARRNGISGFFMFGEVSSEKGDPEFLSEFSTDAPLDASLDFGFFHGARHFVSQAADSAELYSRFEQDDFYTDHDSNAHAQTTFLDNHDAGRFAYFLGQDNPGASADQIVKLVQLGQALLLFSRGQPVLYYGDEQGMVGIGNDMGAREDMFGSKADKFRDLPLLGTTRTGGDDKFDEQHPLFRYIQNLVRFRLSSPAFQRGAMLLRPSANAHVFAFSRVERNEQIEYLVALNNSRTDVAHVNLPTSAAAGVHFSRVLDATAPEKCQNESLSVDDQRCVSINLRPLEWAVWKADTHLLTSAGVANLRFTTPNSEETWHFDQGEVDGQTFVRRHEIRVDVANTDGVGEVTFLMTRRSRPGQYEWLGTDDAPPYRIWWSPPADLRSDDPITFIATFDDIRGRRASISSPPIQIAADGISYGIRGSAVPSYTRMPPDTVSAHRRDRTQLIATCVGTAPLEYQWYKNGLPVPGATESTLKLSGPASAQTGTYFLLTHNVAGTTITHPIVVISPSP